MNNELRLSFDRLCVDCEDAGLDRPYMCPCQFMDKWEVHIGSKRFTGTAGVALDKSYYWVDGYRALQEIQEDLERDIQRTRCDIPSYYEPAKVGIFTCNSLGGLRVDVTKIGQTTARMVIGCQGNTEIYVNKNSAEILARFFTRLNAQLEK